MYVPPGFGLLKLQSSDRRIRLDRLPPRSKESLFNFDELPPFEGERAHSLLYVIKMGMN